MEIPDQKDAFGHEMYDHLHGKKSFEIIERNDGLFNVSMGAPLYFSPFQEWMDVEKQAIQHARGRVLDIGCGAGRHALYLQEQGLEVMGIDSSPLAIKTCQERGVKDARLLALTQVAKKLGVFDTILMMGNNFCLLGTPERAVRLLKRYAKVTSPAGQIIAFTRNPYGFNPHTTPEPEHTSYHQWNRENGRMGGQARIRVRYKKYVSDWIDFLMVSPQEMEALLTPTSWRIEQILEGEAGIYCALLHKPEQMNERK